MTGTQKYLFDLQGFLVVEDVLTDQECETAKRKIRERMQPLRKDPGRVRRERHLARCPGTPRRG